MTSDLPPLDEVNEVAVDMGLDAMAAVIHGTAISKGFWPNKYYVKHMDGNIDLGSTVVSEEAICTKLVLVHSEVTEILEAFRKSQGEDKQLDEFADVLIRLLDLYAGLRDTGQLTKSLEEAVLNKMQVNSGRPKLHGNRF